jgi:uncharacterized protein RhaS with RHS repeats
LGLGWVQTAFRSYDPQLGRFHQIDLLTGIIPSINPYQYALNNPTTLSDPTGLLPESDEPSSRDPGGDSEDDPGKGKKKANQQQSAQTGPAFYEDAYWERGGPGHKGMVKALDFFPPTAAVNSGHKYFTGQSAFDPNQKADGFDYAFGWLDIFPEGGTAGKFLAKYTLGI